MAKKVLLLNHSYEVLSFITERKAIRLIVKEKVEVLHSWIDGAIKYASGVMNFPAVIRLKYLIKKSFSRRPPFSRRAVFKRDKNECQYCGQHLNSDSITIDHITPRSRGGKSTFENCVTSCKTCNKRKGHKSIEEAGLTLRIMPVAPKSYPHFVDADDAWNDEWNKYLGLGTEKAFV